MLQEASLKDRKSHRFVNLSGPNLICAFSTRISNNMSLFYGDTANVLKSRRDFLKELGVDYHNLVCAKQVHGNIASYINEADSGKGALSYESSIPHTDSLVTDKNNLPLAIFTADCLPVFLYDARNHGIALVHAGWRSSKENILAETIKVMREKFNTEMHGLCAGFGPSIRSCCYEVGQEFADIFAVEYLAKKESHYYLDLAGINKKQLLDLGAKEENIFDSGICTACHSEEFFSFRKDGPGTGRMMSVMMLR